jgi:hypothetical protein
VTGSEAPTGSVAPSAGARPAARPAGPREPGAGLAGLIDVLDRADPSVAFRRPLPRHTAGRRTAGALGRPAPLPPARPVPVLRATDRTPPTRPAGPAPDADAPPAGAGLELLRRVVPRGAGACLRGWRAVVRRAALWGAGPDGVNLAWHTRRPAAAPRPDGPVLLRELPSTPTVRPAVPSPAAGCRPRCRVPPRASGGHPPGARAERARRGGRGGPSRRAAGSF